MGDQPALEPLLGRTVQRQRVRYVPQSAELNAARRPGEGVGENSGERGTQYVLLRPSGFRASDGGSIRDGWLSIAARSRAGELGLWRTSPVRAYGTLQAAIPHGVVQLQQYAPFRQSECERVEFSIEWGWKYSRSG